MLTAAAAGAATQWRDAVRAAAALLVEAGATTADYGELCIKSAEELGPYFVLSPGVALAHARAEKACHHPGLSLLRLDDPVEFGHDTNDPVDLVFCLASPDNESHMAGLRSFAIAMSNGLSDRLRGAAPEDLDTLLVEASVA